LDGIKIAGYAFLIRIAERVNRGLEEGKAK
jgi:hypothetical protein